MIVRSRSPLRIGLAGGGTDVGSYSEMYNGAVLNATIALYAHASIEPTNDGKIIFNAVDRGLHEEIPAARELALEGLLLHRGIYNRIVRDYAKKPLSFRLTTYVDAPLGSGLGSSSSLVVAIVNAFAAWLKIPLGEYELARLAHDIERHDLSMAGGKQDHYAATFGGVNFMEFLSGDNVIINPLRVKKCYLDELEERLLLYYTGTSRLSSRIIEQQTANVEQKNEKPIEAMHQLKDQAALMKEAVLKGELDRIGAILANSWQHKKLIAKDISSPLIDEIYEAAIKAGAMGGKITGAGGGGFMCLYCPDQARHDVIKRLEEFEGEVHPFRFTQQGASTWIV